MSTTVWLTSQATTATPTDTTYPAMRYQAFTRRTTRTATAILALIPACVREAQDRLSSGAAQQP